METTSFHQIIQVTSLIPGQQNKHMKKSFRFVYPDYDLPDTALIPAVIFFTPPCRIKKTLPSLSEYRHSWERALSGFSQGNKDTNRWTAPGL